MSDPRRSDAPTTRLFSLLVCYDVADDRRRGELSDLLEELGPRVQLSVFECKVRGSKEVKGLSDSIRNIIDPHEDQVRVYNLGARLANPTILGHRELEEWRDFKIL